MTELLVPLLGATFGCRILFRGSLCNRGCFFGCQPLQACIHSNLDTALADVNACFKSHLTINATRILAAHGPQGGA